MLKSTASIACSCVKPPTKRTTIAAPSSATLVRWMRSVAIRASAIRKIATAIAITDPVERARIVCAGSVGRSHSSADQTSRRAIATEHDRI